MYFILIVFIFNTLTAYDVDVGVQKVKKISAV